MDGVLKGCRWQVALFLGRPRTRLRFLLVVFFGLESTS